MNNENVATTLECVGFEPVLTKREAFAMAAMQGLLSNPSIHSIAGFDTEVVAIDAVMFADALLAELAKVPT